MTDYLTSVTRFKKIISLILTQINHSRLGSNKTVQDCFMTQNRKIL